MRRAERGGGAAAARCRSALLSALAGACPGEVQHESGPLDLVTVADIETEAWLTEALTALCRSLVLGEEAFPNEVGVGASALHPSGLSAPLTARNFVEGQRDFCSMVALYENGQVQAGWIYLPIA